MRKPIFTGFLILGIFLFAFPAVKVFAGNTACESVLACPADYPFEINSLLDQVSVRACTNNSLVIQKIGYVRDNQYYTCIGTDSINYVYERGGQTQSGDPSCCPSGYSPLGYWDFFGQVVHNYRRVCCPNNSTDGTYLHHFDGDDLNASPELNADQTEYTGVVTTSSGTVYCYAGEEGVGEDDRKEGKGDYDPVSVGSVSGNLRVEMVRPQTTTNYICSSQQQGTINYDNCVTDENGQPVNRTSANTEFGADEATICQTRCWDQGSTVEETLANGDKLPKRCFDGSWVSQEEYVRLSQIPQGCVTVSDPKEQEICEKCVQQVGSIYTSIGCVDTSRDGIITRIFQIAIGVIGFFMIFRVISAALKMQTDNPEQIKEAWEMIWSALFALLVLVGAVVILRFLGINLLGIFPADFLQ